GPPTGRSSSRASATLCTTPDRCASTCCDDATNDGATMSSRRGVPRTAPPLVGLVLATLVTRLPPGGTAVPRTNPTPLPTPLQGVRSATAVRPRLQLALDPYRVTLFLITVLTISRIHQHYPMLARVRPILVLYLCAVLII